MLYLTVTHTTQEFQPVFTVSLSLNLSLELIPAEPSSTGRQGMVDGSTYKPALRQDTGYMVEKTYLDIAPYLGAFGAYLMPQ